MGRRVTHLIIGLGKGGAETMLYQILANQTDKDIAYSVVSLGISHYYEPMIKDLGVELIELELTKRPIQALWRSFREFRKADVLCCWMYHANFLGYYLGRLARVPRMIWCIRHSNLDPKLNKSRTLWINKVCAKKSRNVDCIAYNGNRARAVHEGCGYCPEHAVVLDNGCDCNEFVPIDGAKARLQKELHLPTNKRIILSVAKDHPIKDVPTFIKAFSLIHEKLPDTVAVMCGMGIENGNSDLFSVINENDLKIGKDVFLLGMRHDVPALMSASDLFILHSAGEAFPNTLLQAMSCACLCVATDVGDVRRILGQDDLVVESVNAKAMAEKAIGLLTLSETEAREKKHRNRNIVLKKFDIHQIVKGYEELF